MLAVLQARLDEHLDRRERVADLVGDAGGELADGRELLGPEDLALALLELLHHLLDAGRESFHLVVQFAEASFAGEDDLGNDRAELAGRVPDLDLQPADRPAPGASDPEAEHDPGDGAKAADPGHSPGELIETPVHAGR